MPASEPVVYVIDDDPTVRISIGRLLASVGLRHKTFSAADEFIKDLDPEQTGCVVVDVRMPGISGLDVQRTLSDRGVDLPVIFVTGYADVAVVVRAMKAGASDVLTKPFGGQELIDAVHKAIADDRLRRQEHQAVAQLRDRYNSLTPREREVMGLVVAGRLNRQIALDLGTTVKTIKAHRAQVMKKMNAGSLPDLVRIAGRLDLSTVSLAQAART